MYEERALTKRIIIVAVAVVLVVSAVMLGLVAMNGAKQTTKQTRLEGCQLIQDERTRDDCLNGGYGDVWGKQQNDGWRH